MSTNIQARKKALKRIARDFLVNSKLYQCFSPFYMGIGSILMFHNITASDETNTNRLLINKGLDITQEYLERIINHLIQQKYEFLSMDEVYEVLQSCQKQKKRFVCITFDDGYSSNYTLAYPVFKKYKVPFTIYVAPHLIDRTSPLWWFGLEALVLRHTNINFSYENQNFIFETNSDAEKEGAFLALREAILTMDQSQVFPFLETLFAQYDIDVDQCAPNMMSWSQIQELSQDPLVTIGAHTLNHFALKSLPDTEIVAQELTESRRRIELHIGRPVEHFAYPYGDAGSAGKREYKIAAQVGFKTATMAVSGNIFPEHKNYLYSLPRLYISGEQENLEILELALSGTAGALSNKFKRTYLST